jgi:hypothetical protein
MAKAARFGVPFSFVIAFADAGNRLAPTLRWRASSMDGRE